jgi:RNA polymerase sigma-70 factor (ECF subfamily)
MEEERRRFEGLWDDYHDQVMAYARRRTSPAHAEDVVDETFLVTWRRLSDVPEDALPWLFGVARRVIANHRRSLRRSEALVSKLSGLPVEAAPDPATTTVGSPIMSALARISPRDREVLALVVWEGLGRGPAAAAAGCTQATFAVRLHRARKRLYAAMKEIEQAGQIPGEDPMPPTPLSEDAP